MRFTRETTAGLALLLGLWTAFHAGAQTSRNASRPTGTNRPPATEWSPLDFGGPDRKTQPHDFTEGPSEAPAVQAIWRVIWHFEDVSISRPQLLVEAQAFLKQFPDSAHADRAKETADRLQKMIAEDEAHAKTAPQDLEKLPVPERVAELIFRLRDQNGYQSGQPGMCDIFQDVRRSTNTAAHELVRIGYPAVPQLIFALDDRTFTRSVGFWRNFRFSHKVLTVGDCALAILQRISGKSLYERRTTSSYYSTDGSSAVRQAAEEWYADLQRTGEKQYLINATEAGDANSPAQAKMLLERYPDIAADAIIKGVRAVRTLSHDEAVMNYSEKTFGPISESIVRSTINASEYPRKQLLTVLAQSELRDEHVTAFLMQQLKEAPDLGSRIQAADGLRRRDRPEGVAAMIQEWPKLVKERAERGEADFVTMVNFGELQEFLASSDSPDAIKALSDDLRPLSAQDRFRVIGTIGYIRTSQTSGGKVQLSIATLAAIEESLVTALDDTEIGRGTSFFRNGRSYSNTRICDNAALYLAERWPDRYHFDLGASYKVRERQRIQCLNVWRSLHNQPPLPLPEEPATHVSADEAVKVTAIEWAPDGVKPTEAFVAKINALQNKLLTAQAMAAVLRDYVTNSQAGTSGLELKVRKDEDLTGVKLWLRLQPGTVQPTHWKYQKNVTLGESDLLNNFSSGPAKYDMLDDLYGVAARAIAGPAETPFLIHVNLTGETRSQHAEGR